MNTFDFTKTLAEIKPLLNLCCWTSEDSSTLIHAATAAVENNVKLLSVEPVSIPLVWSWTEKTPLKLYAFMAADFNKQDEKKLISDMNIPLKRGASGIQIYTPVNSFESLVNALLPIRHDLFFGRDLTIALPLDNITPNQWPMIFQYLSKLDVSRLLLIASKPLAVAQHIYGLLSVIPAHTNWSLDVCVTSSKNAIKPIEDTFRLTQKMAPWILDQNKLHFFVQPSFFQNYPRDTQYDDADLD